MPVNPPVLRIGPFSIVRELGEGATSNVYLALRDGSYASVALKQLRKASRSELHKAMFATEVELGRKMQHRNIVRVLDADLKEKSGAYLVMEYINGKPLDRHDDADNLLPLDKVLSVVAQVAEALKYAAEMGGCTATSSPATSSSCPTALPNWPTSVAPSRSARWVR